MAETAVKDIKVEITEIQPCVKKLSIEIPESAVAQKSESALKDIRKNARVQGFRKATFPKRDPKSTRLNFSPTDISRMPSSS